jgi:hypothetical protein
MQEMTQIYIDGRFVELHGTESFDLQNPTMEEVVDHPGLGMHTIRERSSLPQNTLFQHGRDARKRFTPPPDEHLPVALANGASQSLYDVATMAGISVRTITVRLSRSREELRGRLPLFAWDVVL